MPGIRRLSILIQPQALRMVLVLLVSGLLSPTLRAQVTPAQQAQMLLNSARQAYNEGQLDFAQQRFREFLQRFGGQADAAAAKYGLALCLLEQPQPKYQEARDLLQSLAGNKNVPDYAAIVYHLGLALRGLGVEELRLAEERPNEAPQRLNTAQQRFTEATPQFAAAVAAYAALVKEPPAAPKPLPAELEWAARARCEQAEMELRTQKLKEAQATAAPFLKDPVLSRSRYKNQGRYYYGFASFLLKDYPAAEMTLAQLAPFHDPVFGTHARYLLARTHHLAEERTEAAAHYEGVLNDYAKAKEQAVEALKQPDRFKNDPAERLRVEALAKQPAPDHVGRASFYWGVLLYEGGQFGQAQARFEDLSKSYPRSPLLNEAQLRLGFCQVQNKQYPEALKTLEPLLPKEPKLADQILFWIGKAKAGAAPDPANYPAYEQVLKTAIDTFRQAADRAQQLTGSDPQAKERRGEILLEMADTMQQIKQYKEAAPIYAQLVAEKVLPQRDEELAVRRLTALHLSGAFDEADNACKQFVAAHPKSTLLPAVLFRYAENQFFRTEAAEKNANLPSRATELAKMYDETSKRYQDVVSKYPEFPQLNLARYGVALAHYRKGELEKAKTALEAIPATERNGSLAIVSYVLADCLLRLAPATLPDDALAAGQLEDQLKTAATQLDAFIGADPKANEIPDALLKLGLCQQRMAELLAQPMEKNAMIAAARATYEKLLQPQYNNHPLQPQARIERARCMVLANDLGGAVNELRQFTGGPLQNAKVAPLAALQLAILLQKQNQPPQAVEVLAKARQQYEAALKADPERSAWVPLLAYHHGLALKRAGKLPEATTVFDQIVKQMPASTEAPEAALRWSQCRKEESQKLLAVISKSPTDQAAVAKQHEDGQKILREAAQFLEAQIQQLQQKQPTLDTRARMLYESAWIYRELAALEIAAVRTKLRDEQARKLNLDPQKDPLPPIALTQIPVQPSEQKAREQYQALSTAFPDLPLTIEATFELAELYGDRNEYDPAIKLLAEALDREPPAELTDKIRIRLGASHAAKGNTAEALTQFDAVAQNPQSKLFAQAQYRAGECLLQAKQWTEAIKRLVLFRDNPQYHNVAGVSDRALLRLGYAYAQVPDWNQSRQAYEALAGRFGNSPWLHEARYGMGWALQQQKQLDQAVNVYTQVTNSTLTETAAKAQLQIGLCRLEQKRYPEACAALLVVPFTYDFPELSAVALLEAARGYSNQGQPQHAERLLQRVQRDYPNSRWAEAAQERLAALRNSGTKAN